MFERSRIDNVAETTSIPVEMTLCDGRMTKGKLFVPTGKTLGDVLNSAGGFVEFEAYGGERTFVAKVGLASVKPIGVPKLPNLQVRVRDLDGFDPYAILGVSAGASREEVRSAYVRLAKIYHPDRYAAAELPPEAIEYLLAMARRINAAHAALNVEHKKQAARVEPIFTSPGR